MIGPTWTREGGLRWPALAQLTYGFGLGRWTQAELDKILADAAVDHEEIRRLFEDDR